LTLYFCERTKAKTTSQDRMWQ